MAMALCCMFVFKLCTRGATRHSRPIWEKYIVYFIKILINYYCLRLHVLYDIKYNRTESYAIVMWRAGAARATSSGGSHFVNNVENFNHGR